MIAIDVTSIRLTISGSKNKDRPNPIEPTTSPITIPTTGKMYMYFATVSRFVAPVGKIVKNEKIEPISLSM